MKTPAFRIALDVVLLVAIFILPWWLWLVCAAVSVFVINRQYEIIPIAFLADAAYTGGRVTEGDFGFFFLASVAVLLIIAILLRPRLNLYDKYF